jgi:ferric-dicitrate binding protein FerR (iron transport regulator)
MHEIDTIIQKYLQGKTSEEENHQLHQWIQQSSENKKRLFAEKDIWDTYGFHSNQKKYEVTPELKILKNRIEIQNPDRSIQLINVLKIAAILLITFGLGWSSQYISLSNKQQPVEVSTQDITVPKGQVNQIFLADGTRIWINSGSRLTLPSVFAPNERVIKLNGEAFFEVAKDKKRPFIVKVNGQQIKVFGTSFNVRAYDNSTKIETTLETGQIQLQVGNETKMMNPGEQSLFNKTEKQLVINKVDPVTFSSWKDGRYEFQNEDLMEVFKVVERWYDVEITYDENTFKEMHFSGVIKRNKDAKHFLDLLNLTIPISYEIHGDKIKILPK